jgi:hypothetical protein
MLAVDVSFLAVGNVNISTSQSVGVIANYLSTIFITGSLILSLLLARQTQKYDPESAEGAVSFSAKHGSLILIRHFRHGSCQI